MIVVEGPDGCGKTTLVRELASEHNLLDAPYNLAADRDVASQLDVRERTYTGLRWAMGGKSGSNEGDCIIHDRFFWSEEVYGKLLRGQSRFNVTESYRMMKILGALQCPIIFCIIPFEMSRPHLEGTPPVLENWNMQSAGGIWQAYKTAADVAFGKGLKVCVYDYTNELTQSIFRAPLLTLPQVHGEVENYLRRREEWS